MDFTIKHFNDLNDHLKTILPVSFLFTDFQISEALDELNEFLSNAVPGLYVGIESKYVDKLYRDCYYHYYSSKLKPYQRDCIRLSFFAEEVTDKNFHNQDGVDFLQKHFMGYLVLRPIPSAFIGRNLLRPDFFVKTNSYHCVIATLPSSVNGIKLMVEGFPHASQDQEFMVCAETTLWSIMEYYSHKYADYNPVLPKKIHSLLSTTSMQRQVPSTGLTGLQISYALKEYGFGVKLYTSGSYTQDVLEDMVKIYVESGIPVVVAITNNKGIAHVLNLTGHTGFDLSAGFSFSSIDTLPTSGKLIFDYYEQHSRYLVIDDNMPPYTNIPLDDPACNYTNPNWAGCSINAAIVPLPQRVYMEADRAKKLAIESLKSMDRYMNFSSNLILRVLLSSSRSFKHSVSVNPDLDDTTKTLIVNLDVPKFVWIAEIGTEQSFKNGKATGMMIMDATEPIKHETLAYLLENTYIGKVKGEIDLVKLTLQPFNIHQNLKPF